MVASEPDVLKAITEFYGLRHSVKRAERDLSSGIDLGNLEQLVRMKNEAEIESSDQHVVNAVEFMLQHAFESRASDIHIEPKREDSLIRFRIDGVLHDIQKMPKIVHAAVTSRIKTMSRLDIAEKRRPAGRPGQDEPRRPRGRAARLDPARGFRREAGDAHLRSRRW